MEKGSSSGSLDTDMVFDLSTTKPGEDQLIEAPILMDSIPDTSLKLLASDAE